MAWASATVLCGRWSTITRLQLPSPSWLSMRMKTYSSLEVQPSIVLEAPRCSTLGERGGGSVGEGGVRMPAQAHHCQKAVQLTGVRDPGVGMHVQMYGQKAIDD